MPPATALVFALPWRSGQDLAEPPPTLRLGSRGDAVRRLQRVLQARSDGSSSLAVDGEFGPETRRALLAFQRSNGTAADGVVGPATWFELLKGEPAQGQSGAVGSSSSSRATGASLRTAPIGGAAPGASADVAAWTLTQKFTEVLKRTAGLLPGSMRTEFLALLTPKSLAIMVATLVVWAGSHVFGVGEVADVLLLITGIGFMGFAAFDVADQLRAFLTGTCMAGSDRDLDEAAGHLAHVIAVIGVMVFVALLAKVARLRRSRGGTSEGGAAGGAGGESVRAADRSPSGGSGASPSATASEEAAAEVVPKKPLTALRVGDRTADRVLPGDPDKVAVIGRSMGSAQSPGVRQFAATAQQEGYEVSIFDGDAISPEAKAEWAQLTADGHKLSDAELLQTKMYAENLQWAQDMKASGYTIADLGSPPNASTSIFYEMEKSVIFGGGK